MFIYIPGLVELADFLIADEYNQALPIASIALAVFFFFYRFWHPAEYGRLKPKNKKYGTEISPKLAFAIFNLIPIFFVFYIRWYYQTVAPGMPLVNLPIIFWVSVYIFRGTIYAMMRSKASNPWPIKTVIYFLLINITKSILFVRCISAQNWRLEGVKIYICVALFVLSFILNAYYDIDLTSKRFKNVKGYRFLKGGLYNTITCPNYFFEFLMNVALIFMIDNDIFSVGAFIWLLPNVLTRAESLHAWCKRFHKPNYPQKRSSFLPFIKLDSILGAFVSVLEYGGF